MSACIACLEIILHHTTSGTPITKRYLLPDVRSRSEEASCGLCRVLFHLVERKSRNHPGQFRECACSLAGEPEAFAINVTVSSNSRGSQRKGWPRDLYEMIFDLRLDCGHVIWQQPYKDKFRVYAEYGGHGAIFLSGRGRDPNNDSAGAYAKIQEWMSACEREHPGCRQRNPTRLPTRLLDVGPPDGSCEPKVYISRADDHCPYLALSYCWGSPQSIQLGNASLEAMCKEIRLQSLPQSVQDAIAVTRRLGYQYIWIDSLCIIQDSEEDISREIGCMADIYKGAFLTISAAKASDCHQGFLESTPLTRPQPISSLIVRVPLLYGDSALGQIVLEDFAAVDNPEPISRRAWTLQERLLPKRQIIYASDALTWKCRSTAWGWRTWPRVYNEYPPIDSLMLPEDTSISPEYHQPPDLGSAASTVQPAGKLALYNPLAYVKPISAERTGRHSFMDYWVGLVGAYAVMELSEPRDRLPAISGIASEVSRISSAMNLPAGKYAAGLWEADLPRQLLWTVLKPQPRLLPYRAPSWSWVSAMDDELVFYPQVLEEYRFKVDAQVLECSTTPLSDAALFGQVKSGFLKLRARLLKGAAMDERLIEKHVDRGRFERDFFFIDHDESDEYQREKAYSSWWAQLGECCGLILESIEGEKGVYRRVGVFHSERTAFPSVEPSVFIVV